MHSINRNLSFQILSNITCKFRCVEQKAGLSASFFFNSEFVLLILQNCHLFIRIYLILDDNKYIRNCSYIYNRVCRCRLQSHLHLRPIYYRRRSLLHLRSCCNHICIYAPFLQECCIRYIFSLFVPNIYIFLRPFFK